MRTPWRVAWFLLLALPVATASAAEVAYRAGRIWPGDGPPIADAVLLVREGRIVAVGPFEELTIPETARIIDLGPSSVLIPGLISAESGLGGLTADDVRALTPEVRAIDGFDPFADYHEPLSGGVTTVHLSPGRGRLMPGRGAVVKLAGPDLAARTLEPEGDLRIILTPDSLRPPRIYEPPPRIRSRDRPIHPTQPQLATSLAGAVAGLRSVIAASLADRPEEAEGTDPLLDPLAEALDQTGRLRILAPTAAEIRAALALAREFDLRLVLVGPTELSPFLDRLDSWAEVVDGVVLDVRARPGQVVELPVPSPEDPEPREVWQDAAALLDAGLTVAVVPNVDADLNELLFLAGAFRAGGLTEEQVLRMVTSAPAELLGVTDRVGSLSPGKDADFAVLSADPFDLHARVIEVYVLGRRAWSADVAEDAKAIRVGSARLGDGSSIDDATIVVQGGKIRGVGPDASAPIDAERFDFGDAIATPGLIDLATDLGLGGPLSSGSRSSMFTVPVGTFPVVIPIETDGPSAPEGTTSTSVGLDERLGDRLVSDDPAAKIARRGGITTVLAGPRGGAPAPVIAFKLGDEPTVLRDPVAIRFRLSGDVTTAVPSLRSTLRRAKSYADSWEKYERDLAEYQKKAKEYEEARARIEAKKEADTDERKEQENDPKENSDAGDNSDKPQEDAGDNSDKPQEVESDGEREDKDEREDKEEGSSSRKKPEEGDPESKDGESSDDDELPEKPEPPRKPREVASLEPYRDLFSGEIPALVEAERRDEIRAAVELFRDEFEIDAVLLGAGDAYREVDLLEDKGVAVVVGPELVRRVDREDVNLAQVLATWAVPFGFQSEAGTGSGTLPRAVRYAVRRGLGPEDALAGFTSSPAQFLGLSDRIGLIEPGKDADLVIWSGPPFSSSSRVLGVMIDGQWVYLASEDDSR